MAETGNNLPPLDFVESPPEEVVVSADPLGAPITAVLLPRATRVGGTTDDRAGEDRTVDDGTRPPTRRRRAAFGPDRDTDEKEAGRLEE